jgi:hypothetical protein
MYQNPVVPAEASLNQINFNASIPEINLVFPTSFPPYVANQYAMSATVIFSNTLSAPIPDIKLPDATLGAIGNSTIFYNIASSNIPINDAENQEVYILEPGDGVLLILNENATVAGNWVPVVLGATTSGADASSLAGGGLTALANKLNTSIHVVLDSTLPSTFTAAQSNQLFIYNGSGNLTWDLPAAPFLGFMFYVKNQSTGNGIITINAPVGGTINGQSTITLTLNETLYLISNNLDWYTIGTNVLSGSGVRITANGIQVINGSASQPSYSFINYTNTGFYSAGASELGVTVESQNVANFIPEGINADSFYWEGLNILSIAGLYP